MPVSCGFFLWGLGHSKAMRKLAYLSINRKTLQPKATKNKNCSMFGNRYKKLI